jgi:hypothetical protein
MKVGQVNDDWKDFGRKVRDLIFDTIPEFAWRDWGKPKKNQSE